MSPQSKDLIARLRIVAGQCVIQPPAIDIEAANYIEKLDAELAQARAALRIAFDRSNERAASRLKWTVKDQDAHEAIKAAMTAAT